MLLKNWLPTPNKKRPKWIRSNASCFEYTKVKNLANNISSRILATSNAPFEELAKLAARSSWHFEHGTKYLSSLFRPQNPASSVLLCNFVTFDSSTCPLLLYRAYRRASCVSSKLTSVRPHESIHHHIAKSYPYSIIIFRVTVIPPEFRFIQALLTLARRSMLLHF